MKHALLAFRLLILLGLLGFSTPPRLARAQAGKAQANAQASAQAGSKFVRLPGGTRMEFVPIPAGSFTMGSPEDELHRHGDEGPLRSVRLTAPIYMGAYEVTQAQWKAVMGTNPSIFQDGAQADRRPVDMVSWEDCQAFIEALNQLGIGRFRLPTEAEWEYACRAGSTARFYWGDDPEYRLIGDYSWYYSRAEGQSRPVGLKQPNAWGLYDMCGNVWEWCSDWKGPYEGLSTENPAGPAEGSLKIFRGGSWFNRDQTLRCANRNAHEANVPYTNIGLRLVMEVQAPDN